MSYPVTLYVYDLSRGMARTLGPSLGLPNLDGVWHTAIVVHDTEIFFGGSGIEHCLPGTTMLGRPMETKNLGSTSISMENLTNYLRQIGQSEFHGSRYDLFKHNCNNFSSALTKFLGVNDIPQHILDLPDQVLASPVAALLRPIMEQATPDGQGTPFGDGTTPPTTTGANDSTDSSQHFPPKEYSLIKVPIDVDKVMSKIISFNDKSSFRLDEDQLTKIRLLTEQDVKVSEEIIDEILVPVMNQWATEDTFPFWHFVSHNVVENKVSTEIASKLYQLIKANLHKTDSPHTRMCLRIIVSFFQAAESRIIVQKNREDIIGDINSLIEESENDISPQVENAVASLIYNFSKLFYDLDENCIEAAFQLISSIVSVQLPRLKGPEAVYKIVAAAATLMKLDQEIIDLAQALDLPQQLAIIPKGRMAKLDECVTQCKSIVSN